MIEGTYSKIRDRVSDFKGDRSTLFNRGIKSSIIRPALI
jgi:hypothetical protein